MKRTHIFVLLGAVSLCLFLSFWPRGLQYPTQLTTRVLPANSETRPRIEYKYAVVRSGVFNSQEAEIAVATDPIIRAHYRDINLGSLRRVASSGAPMYVSYRKHDRVYWTSKKVRVPKGESLLSDGSNLVRNRCGNRLSETKQLPIERGAGLSQEDLETPLDAQGEASNSLVKNSHNGNGTVGELRYANPGSSSSSASPQPVAPTLSPTTGGTGANTPLLNATATLGSSYFRGTDERPELTPIDNVLGPGVGPPLAPADVSFQTPDNLHALYASAGSGVVAFSFLFGRFDSTTVPGVLPVTDVRGETRILPIFAANPPNREVPSNLIGRGPSQLPTVPQSTSEFELPNTPEGDDQVVPTPEPLTAIGVYGALFWFRLASPRRRRV